MSRPGAKFCWPDEPALIEEFQCKRHKTHCPPVSSSLMSGCSWVESIEPERECVPLAVVAADFLLHLSAFDSRVSSMTVVNAGRLVYRWNLAAKLGCLFESEAV
jgi:hypothetical protein